MEKQLRFRGSIYVDIYVDDMPDAEEQAKRLLRRSSNEIPNSFTGGVARLIDGDLIGNSDRLSQI